MRRASLWRPRTRKSLRAVRQPRCRTIQGTRNQDIPFPKTGISATSAINRDRACVKTRSETRPKVCFDAARELFTTRVVLLFLVALCFCSPAPRFSSVYYVDAFLPFRYESFVVRNDSSFVVARFASFRYYRSVIYTRHRPKSLFSWIFSSP